MRIINSLALIASVFGQDDSEGRRATAISSGFNNGRDFFANQERTDNGDPLFSVDDIDISNRLKPDLRCKKPVIPGSLTEEGSRIVGGYQAQRSAWPFIVKIRIGCGGSIVSNNWVVTAAHCCRVSNIRFLDVTVGEYDRGANDLGARTIQVKNKIIHPEFVPTTLKNDICLLELMEPIVFSDFAQPVCFPPKNSRIDANVKLGEGPMCYVAGWGRIGETLGTARVLQETQVPIVNNTVCDKAYMRNHVTEEAMVCAGYAEGGIDACQGDSGGPLICVEDNQPVLRGVVSWGIGCARKGLYGVYSRTSSYIDWVRSVVNPNDLNAGQIATTPKTTTSAPKTTQPVTLSGDEQDFSARCGTPANIYRLADNVVVGCSKDICKFKCPIGMVSTVPQVKCIQRKGNFVPKKIKKGVHCRSAVKEVAASNGGGFSAGSDDASSSIALNSGESNTNCGNVIKKFKLDTSQMDVDCNEKSATQGSCDIICKDKSMQPTLASVRCLRKNIKSKKWKFAPKKAKIACKIPKSNGKSEQAVRKLDTLAEETCGYLPVTIDSPAEYFCEEYTCWFYCSDPHHQPNRERLTCNPKKKSWWPKRLTIFCQ